MGTQQAEMAQRVLLLLCSLAFAWVSAAPVVRPSSMRRPGPSSARSLLGRDTNGTRTFSAKLTNTGLSGKQAPDASGTAIITLYRDNALETFIRWDLTSDEKLGETLDSTAHGKYVNQIIGVHIHVGDKDVANGPILYGQCGGGKQLPSGGDLVLPEFGRLCDQSSTTTGLIPYTGVACTLTGAGSPCFNSGNSTLASLGSYMRQATPGSIYINLHTTRSRDAAFPKPLGLIRGQLKAL